MAQNTASPDVHEIPLDVLGGMVTYQDPSILPSGVSPDCADVEFSPGSVSSRSGLQKQLATPLGNVTLTYCKSYVDPTQIIRTFYLDSAGNFWMDIVSPPSLVAAPTVIFTTTPGSYAKSVTAFGREYVAISDKLHGSDIPYQITGLPDGTVQIDRVTQDGPGASPSVANLILPPVNVAAGSTDTLTITEVDPENADPNSGFFTSINVYTASSLASVVVGQVATISGTGTAFDGSWGPITAIFPGSPNFIQVAAYIPAGTVFWTGSASMAIQLGALVRNANVVTAKTATAHQLQPGYQVQITNALTQTVGSSISSIVINNENLAGLATVTTSTAHGLTPGLNVSITGVPASAGGTISSITRSGQVVTVILTAASTINPGAVVAISGVGTASFNTTAVQVVNVTKTMYPGDTFTFGQIDVDATDSGGGTVVINWPIPDTPAPTYFQVQSAPTPTTFQVQIDYSDGTWSGGSVTYAWNGTFSVQTVPATPADISGNPLTFTYQQYGPNGTASAVSGSIVATPYGQASPGKHQMVCFFIDRQGGLTSYSPPVDIECPGGQYLSVTNIPTGPSPHIVARAIAFTGALGAYFYYIPAPPQVNGQLVGTSTVINDNTTTSAVFDFSDSTLFGGGNEGQVGAISISGNNLENQIVLDGALWFGLYGSRLITAGQRSVVDNLLNMAFDGGALPNMATVPTGWSGGGSGALVAGHYGGGWRTSSTALTQSMYENYTGAPIARANDLYTWRTWISAAGTATATISSALASFSSSVTLTATGAGFQEGKFSTAMPTTIPPDLTLGITGTGNVVVDEMNIVYSQDPFTTGCLGSYVNNPEGLDGVSGQFAPIDPHQTLGRAIIRNTLYLLTRDPGGHLHQVSQTSGEPSSWVVDEVGNSVGAVSAFSITESQANDTTEGGGEEQFGWYSSTGPRIFGGEYPFKIAQEIMRPKGKTYPGSPPDLSAINPAAVTSVWSLNDPDNKLMYFGIPTGTNTAPDTIWVLNYLGCESAGEIAGGDPVHRQVTTGRLTANDLGRKWAPWKRPMNGAVQIYREAGELTTVFLAGNASAPNTSSSGAYGNVYALNPDLLTDDDYGLIVPYYTTYAFPEPNIAQALQIGGGLKMISYCYGLIAGTGLMTISIYYNLLSKLWTLSGGGSGAGQSITVMNSNPNWDTEWPGIQATGKRFWFRFASSPNGGTDNSFELNNWVVAMKRNARMPLRGSNR